MRVLDPVGSLFDDVLLNMAQSTKKKPKNKPGSGSNSRKTSTTPAATDAITNGESSGSGDAQAAVKCNHLLKTSFNAEQVKKKIKNIQKLECQGCRKPKIEVNEDGEDEIIDVHCCLNCGNLGCGRYSEHQHAFSHFKGPRNGPHSLVMNVQTNIVWCYQCDNEVPDSEIPRLKEIIDMIGKVRKNIGLRSTDKNQAGDGNDKKLSTGKEKLALTASKTKTPVKAVSTTLEVKGLTNLGNTCFFNAVMQNMAQTHQLQILLNEERAIYKGALVYVHPTANSDNETTPSDPLQITIHHEYGILTSTLRTFLTDFKQTNKSSILNPGSLFGQICKKAPRFRGYQQQDSQELLRYMLDALKTEELKRIRTAIMENFGLEAENMKPSETIDPKLKKMIKAYDVQTTFVDQIFGGQLLQVIKCLKCQNISKRYEQFLDLSLPIVDAKDMKKTVIAKKDNDDDLNALLRNETKNWKTSKYQQKKAKQKSRKAAKATPKRRNSAAAESTTAEDAQKDDNKENKEPNEMAIGNEEMVDLTDKLATALDFDGTSQMDTSSNNPGLIEPIDAEFIDHDHGSFMECNNNNNEETAAKLSSSEDEEAANNNNDNEQSSTNHVAIQDDLSDMGVEILNEDTNLWRTDCTLGGCLRQFTAIELLNGKNKFGCTNCGKANTSAGQMGNNLSSNLSVASYANSTSSNEESKKNKKDSTPVEYTDAEKRYLIYHPPAVLTLHLKRFHQVGIGTRKINKHVEFPISLDMSPYCCKNGKGISSNQKRVKYELYGIVSHSGSLSGGHYVAYVKIRPKDNKLSLEFLQSGPISLVANDLDANKNCIVKSEDRHQSTSSKMMTTNQLENGLENAQFDKSTQQSIGKWYYISDTHVSEVPESRVLSSEAYLLFYERIRI